MSSHPRKFENAQKITVSFAQVRGNNSIGKWLIKAVVESPKGLSAYQIRFHPSNLKYTRASMAKGGANAVHENVYFKAPEHLKAGFADFINDSTKGMPLKSRSLKLPANELEAFANLLIWQNASPSEAQWQEIKGRVEAWLRQPNLIRNCAKPNQYYFDENTIGKFFMDEIPL